MVHSRHFLLLGTHSPSWKHPRFHEEDTGPPSPLGMEPGTPPGRGALPQVTRGLQHDPACGLTAFSCLGSACSLAESSSIPWEPSRNPLCPYATQGQFWFLITFIRTLIGYRSISFSNLKGNFNFSKSVLLADTQWWQFLTSLLRDVLTTCPAGPRHAITLLLF